MCVRCPCMHSDTDIKYSGYIFLELGDRMDQLMVDW